MDETTEIDFTQPQELAGPPTDDLHVARAQRDAAIGRLRQALIASEPGLDSALVTGETVEEVEASFAAARELVRRVRESVRREAAAAVPAGSPGRVTAVPGTPFEKIRSGLGRLS